MIEIRGGGSVKKNRVGVVVAVLALVVALTGTLTEAQKNLAHPVETTQYPPSSRTSSVTATTSINGGAKRYGPSARNDVMRRYGAAPSATNGHQYQSNGHSNGHHQSNGHTNGHHQPTKTTATTTVTANGHHIPTNNGHHIHDGHRMITRALWRIFDALMQKKDHAQLYGRVGFVEEALKKMITVDSQLEDEIDKLKEGVDTIMTQLSGVLSEMSSYKSLFSRLEALEEAHPELRHQGDQSPPVWGEAAAAYTTCPPPFTRVGGECYYVGVEEMLGWDDARRECGRVGGDLASPRDLPALRHFLEGVQDPPEYLWVGGSMQEDGAWVWTSGPQFGVPVDMSKETWNEEVPSGSGRCMGLFGQSSYRAYNYDCNEKDFYVCQYYF